MNPEIAILVLKNQSTMKRISILIPLMCLNFALYSQTDSPISISGREVFWDEYLTQECTAEKMLHSPSYNAPMITLDKPWEGDGCVYFNLVYDKDNSTWLMYYTSLSMFRPDGSVTPSRDIHACVLTSKDCINWTRPELGIIEYQGSKANNIIVGIENVPGITGMDNFFVMLDPNPNPAVPEKFKAVMRYSTPGPDGTKIRRLASLVSDDGIHFRVLGIVTDKGLFDTLNTVMWHEASGKYVCYIRNFHEKSTFKDFEGNEKVGNINSYVRDIRVLYSDDFIHWSDPQRIIFDSPNDYPLYTSCTSVYPYAPQMFIGFPTRYVERSEWSDNFDQLCGKEKRLERMQRNKRYGLAITDCLFMCSRDGLNWHRFDEAFMRPGPEYKQNWVYGSCYPGVGMIETPSEIKGGDKLLNLFVYRNHWSGEPTVLDLWSIRRDGFVSLHAGVEKKHLLTKPFIFSGNTMKLNFSTSALGNVYITLVREDGLEAHSGELFGDSVDRLVRFDRDLGEFAGRKTQMLIELSDADVYSFDFSE